MVLWKNIKDRAVLDRAQDEAYHAAALEEVRSGHRRDGLWAKAIIESGGDEVRAKIAYLRLLVVALRDEDYLAVRVEELHPHASPATSSSSEIATPKIFDKELVVRCSNAINGGYAIFETYEVLLNEIGGRIQSRGVLFGKHYIVECGGHKARLNNLDNLQRWFVKNVVPSLGI